MSLIQRCHNADVSPGLEWRDSTVLYKLTEFKFFCITADADVINRSYSIVVSNIFTDIGRVNGESWFNRRPKNNLTSIR